MRASKKKKARKKEREKGQDVKGEKQKADTMEYTEDNVEGGDEGEQEEEGEEEGEEDEEYEDEGAGDDEGEWEYYTDEEQEEEAQEEEEEEQFQSVKEEVADEQDRDENKEWIMECMKHIIPNMPTKSKKKSAVESDDSDGQDYDNLDEFKAVENLYSENHGYRDWLKDAAGEISKDPLLEGKEPAGDPDAEGEAVTESKARSRARGIVEKLTEAGPSLKQVLFSLKDVFQSESNLVFEFVELGGLQRLVE